MQRANILKEVTIMRQLDHPNIVQLVAFSESPQYYYIVLELCPGGELFHQIVRLTYFSEELSRHVIVQVAEALEYLHETAGVVHRYVEPCTIITSILMRRPATSNLKIYCSTHLHSFPQEIQGQDQQRMKTKPTKESS